MCVLTSAMHLQAVALSTTSWKCHNAVDAALLSGLMKNVAADWSHAHYDKRCCLSCAAGCGQLQQLELCAWQSSAGVSPLSLSIGVGW